MRCFTLEMIPIPENTSRRSSSLVLATSNPLIKIRFVVSSKPSSNQPCCAARSLSLSSFDLPAPHLLQLFLHEKLELLH